jgi:hypothetical protein
MDVIENEKTCISGLKTCYEGISNGESIER